MSLIYQADILVQGRRPGLYLGGKSDAKNREKLLARNVTHIVNMTPTREASIQAGVPNYFDSDFTYIRVPVYDASTSVTDLLEAADAIVSFIAKALHHGSCLVHCQRGVSRSTTAVLFYLMRRGGMSLDNALSLIQRRRPEAAPIPEFLNMLRQYESRCRNEGSIVEASADATTVKRPAGPSRGPEPPPRKRAMIGPAVVGRDLPAVGPQPPVGPSPRPAAAQEQNELQQQQQQHPFKSKKEDALPSSSNASYVLLSHKSSPREDAEDSTKSSSSSRVDEEAAPIEEQDGEAFYSRSTGASANG